MSFIDILEKHRFLSITEHDKGYRFEKLIQGYLKTEPLYAEIFSDVWLWNDFPYKDQFGCVDLGIDLVCKEEYGGYWAVQCKFYAEGTRIEKSEVDSFLVNSSRTFVIDGKRFEFSQRLWISTTEAWSANADESTKNQKIPFTKITLSDLETANVDWDAINKGIFGDKARKDKKKLRPHQVEAVDSAHEYYKTKSRGKLIMACGTGKTFTALKIAEKESSKGGYVLVLVPSISLLRQTLKEWASDAENGINPICICSDNSVNSKISHNDDVVESVVDLGYPASTNVKSVISQMQMHGKQHNNKLNVVFSTYQSIDVISGVQKQLPIIFDMIICDEAHRTTGVTLAGKDESAFVKVHNNDFINAKKRLYMTATPRLFAESSKAKAEQNSAQLCSMDDVSLYGEEIYRLGFGKAVEKDLLSDYKVLILTLSDNDLTDSVYKYLIGKGTSEINVVDMAKLIGCINALSKRVKGDYGTISTTDPQPMKSAVAFCQRIRDSEAITKCFNDLSSRYLADLPQTEQNKVIPVVSKHIDGSMGAVERDKLISWLKSDSADECHILTNVRCLSEGVDVPSLDAVMFLSPKNSQIDVVQSVGRVMRKTENKKYGYIIIPVVIPNNVSADEALNDNERYKVVWTVLNALRAHDDRFNAVINQIKLNGNKPPKDSPIVVVGVGGDSGDDSLDGNGSYQIPLPTEFVQLQDALFAKLVLKVGEKSYLENWAAEVGEIALKQQARIKKLVENPDVKKIFAEFVQSLQDNINPSISDDEAITMLSQHMITRPIFEALFENYSFATNNAVSLSMEKMIDVLEANAFDKDTKEMDQFYSDAKAKIGRVQNTEGRQKIIVELYNKFFQTAFPKMSEQLGIVYTPVEVVDFIVHSVDDVLRKEFGRGLTDENVHILDPFTGTGTFISRLLSSGLIKPEDLERKYNSEIHANEIVLLAYYIASVNIENVYHGIVGESENYQAFPGICLTDTFQLNEDVVGQLTEKFFPENSERVELQKKSPITVIIGNPPYSAGQKASNDNAQNQNYPVLKKRIADTYSKDSSATLKNSLYDSYIKAFRWSTDRLKNGGIIGFVSNGGWLDGNAMDGFRKNLEKDFNSIYVFNLRGNQRTSGELSRREGGKIFGSGSRAPIAITLLVKNLTFQSDKAKIFYYSTSPPPFISSSKSLSPSPPELV
jgi:predicted helicase